MSALHLSADVLFDSTTSVSRISTTCSDDISPSCLRNQSKLDSRLENNVRSKILAKLKKDNMLKGGKNHQCLPLSKPLEHLEMPHAIDSPIVLDALRTFFFCEAVRGSCVYWEVN